MNLTILLLGIGELLGFFLVFYFFLPRPSPEKVLLEKVTRDARRDASARSPSIVALFNADRMAAPFAFFRSFLGGSSDQDLSRRLMLAGYRKPAYVDIFIGAKLVTPAVLGVAAGFLFTDNVILFFLMALGLGFFAPDFWLGHAINKRRERIRLSIPDGLDLLAICLEAGLGMDQAVIRVGQELDVSHRELSQEFLQVNFEQRAGAPRIAAWKGFADRADCESARSFVAMLMQTDRFGTPISKSLGNFSDALRTQRRQRAEELAAKTTIKLVIPLVLFIFPDVFVVTVGPAVITVMRNLGHIVG